MCSQEESSSFEYSANYEHIVYQGIVFSPASRESEAEEIVKAMQHRYQKRAATHERAAMDKMLNPLISIPGSPGSGKSTFIVHFPESAAYKQYLQDTNRPAAIVSTLTFNSVMDTKCPKINDVGLRIIYGGMRAMLGLTRFPLSWKAFLEKFNAEESFLACDAVDMLRRLFGLNRPVLLLVDELSKATNDKAVMTDLGGVLAEDDNCDVVVTSLSPAYVLELLSGSQRPITYVPVLPLLSTTADLSVGKKECKLWAKKVQRAAGGDLTPFQLNVLEHAYLLASGHPRSLEYMIKKFKAEDVGAGIVSEIKDDRLQSLIIEVARQVEGRDVSVKVMTAKQLEDFVFTAPMYLSVADTQFRELLEKGTIFIHSKKSSGGEDEFTTAVQARSFLTKVIGRKDFHRLGSDETPCTREAGKLLKNLGSEKVSTWWERFLDTTIICRSYSFTSIVNLFGLPRGALGAHGSLISSWDIGVDRLYLGGTRRASPNRLTVPAKVTPPHPTSDHLHRPMSIDYTTLSRIFHAG